MITCTYAGLGDYAALAWALVSLGYAIGLALHRLPLPGGSGSSWGGYLISYALVSAGFVAVLGIANSFNTIVVSFQSAVHAEGMACESLPDIYLSLGMKAFTLLAVMTGVGMGASIIPIVGPAIANVFSVVAAFPGLALSVTLITSFTLMTFLAVFGSLAVALAPAGVALMAVPGGRLKGIGAWFVAAAIVFTAAGPYIPAIGRMACEAEKGVTCNIDKLVTPFDEGTFKGVFDLVGWLFNPTDNELMKMWRFALGSLAGWGILMAASAALSKGIGGVAASLGFG
jgi:hypothetical protein